jgi:hypothetical protein
LVSTLISSPSTSSRVGANGVICSVPPPQPASTISASAAPRPARARRAQLPFEFIITPDTFMDRSAVLGA